MKKLAYRKEGEVKYFFDVTIFVAGILLCPSLTAALYLQNFKVPLFTSS
jgi:hypothetical protein